MNRFWQLWYHLLPLWEVYDNPITERIIIRKNGVEIGEITWHQLASGLVYWIPDVPPAILSKIFHLMQLRRAKLNRWAGGI